MHDVVRKIVEEVAGSMTSTVDHEQIAAIQNGPSLVRPEQDASHVLPK